MPDKTGRLTPAERSFAHHYARTGDVRYSAERAGYAHAPAGHHALSRPGVQEQIAAIRARFVARGVGVGYSTLIEIAEDRTAGKMPRVSAGDKLLKAGGQYGAQPNSADDKPLHELSHAELHRIILSAPIDQLVTDLDPIDVEQDDEPAPAAPQLDDPLFA